MLFSYWLFLKGWSGLLLNVLGPSFRHYTMCYSHLWILAKWVPCFAQHQHRRPRDSWLLCGGGTISGGLPWRAMRSIILLSPAIWCWKMWSRVYKSSTSGASQGGTIPLQEGEFVASELWCFWCRGLNRRGHVRTVWSYVTGVSLHSAEPVVEPATGGDSSTGTDKEINFCCGLEQFIWKV